MRLHNKKNMPNSQSGMSTTLPSQRHRSSALHRRPVSPSRTVSSQQSRRQNHPPRSKPNLPSYIPPSNPALKTPSKPQPTQKPQTNPSDDTRDQQDRRPTPSPKAHTSPFCFFFPPSTTTQPPSSSLPTLFDSTKLIVAKNPCFPVNPRLFSGEPKLIIANQPGSPMVLPWRSSGSTGAVAAAPSRILLSEDCDVMLGGEVGVGSDLDLAEEVRENEKKGEGRERKEREEKRSEGKIKKVKGKM